MAKSKTEFTKSFEDNLVGKDGHYKTTISDDRGSVTGHADTSEKSQEIASRKRR